MLVSENLVAIPRCHCCTVVAARAARPVFLSLSASLFANRQPELHAHYGPGRDVSCQSSNESRLISRASRCRFAEAPPPSFAALDEAFQARP